MEDPYVITIINDKIVLNASQINKELYNNIKLKLIKEHESKCNQYGFVNKIYKLLDYKKTNILDNGSVLFNIQYQAKICSPKIGDIIDAKINKIHIGLISASNGPIRIWINTSNKINVDNLSINLNKELVHNKTKNVLKPDDNIIVRILDVEFLPNDTDIRVYAYLENLKT